MCICVAGDQERREERREERALPDALGSYKSESRLQFRCRIPGVQFHLSPKFAYKELVWDSFTKVRLSVCVRVFDRRYRMIRYNSHLA